MKEDFINYIKIQKRYAEHTLLAYRTDINHLEKFLQTDFDSSLLDATYDMMRSWIVHMIDKKYSKTSIHRKISSAKSFYNFLLKKELIQHNPTQGLVLPKKEKRLPVFLTEKQTNCFCESTTFPDTFEGHRDQLIIEMFYQTGIRLSELVNLEIKNVDLQQQTIKVLGKRNKERMIPIHNGLVTLIEKYLDEKNKLNVITDQKFLYITSKGKKSIQN